MYYLDLAIGIFLGLAGIAVAVFFGLRGFGKGVNDKLDRVNEKLVAIATTIDKVWDLISRRAREQAGTVERHLDNLGKIKVTAEPGLKETSYIVEIENPILHEDYLVKVHGDDVAFKKHEDEILGENKVIGLSVFTPTRMRLRVPSTDPKVCTDFMTATLHWLNTTYVASLSTLGDFEGPILSEGSK